MGTFGAPTVEDIKALGAQLQQTDKETKKVNLLSCLFIVFSSDGKDFLTVFLEGGFAETFDGKEFLFGMRNIGCNVQQCSLVHDHVGWNVILLKAVHAPLHESLAEFFIN